MGKLGTPGHPIIVRVASPEKADEVLALCDERGWKVVVGVEPEEPEDLRDLQKLVEGRSQTRPQPLPSRSGSCFCGSGRKYRNCCGK